MSIKTKYFYLIGEITAEIVRNFLALAVELKNEPETSLCIFIDSVAKGERDIRFGISIIDIITSLKNTVYTVITGRCDGIPSYIFLSVPRKCRYSLSGFGVYIYLNMSENSVNIVQLLDYLLSNEKSIYDFLLSSIFQDYYLHERDLVDYNIATVVDYINDLDFI